MIFKNVREIAEWRLCTGCGACAYVCPEKKVRLIDILDQGIRPELRVDECGSCNICVKICPGYEQTLSDESDPITWVRKQVLEVWEGYASEQKVRYNGSSGGLASAIALYCLEREGWEGVLHVGSDPGNPWKNKTFFSRTRAEVVLLAGSRYSPASPCSELGQIECVPALAFLSAKGVMLLVLEKVKKIRSTLGKNTGVALGIFCAGTPSTKGTLELFKKLGVETARVTEIRYRGKGWPGKFTVCLDGEETPSSSLNYMEAWGFLQKYRPFRCYLCPDGTAQFADIAFGDPWYRPINKNDEGFSLVLVRSENGRRILKSARDAGYVCLQPASPEILEKSQKNLLVKRKTIWGRMLAMKLFGIPAPKLHGFSLFESWRDLPFSQKSRSILGTTRRIIQRRYYHPLKYGTKP
jgi:coenzyme F420 hydrogenase subunit beta